MQIHVFDLDQTTICGLLERDIIVPAATSKGPVDRALWQGCSNARAMATQGLTNVRRRTTWKWSRASSSHGTKADVWRWHKADMVQCLTW